MPTPRWEFWIDVGGTFTDCVARRPDGGLVRQKVLSSAVVKGTMAGGARGNQLDDPARQGEVPDFWRGYGLRLVDRAGQVLGTSTVRASNPLTGTLVLDNLPFDLPGQAIGYELVANEPAPLLAIRLLLGLRRDEPLPAIDVRLGTTRGTNALLTRSGARTALVTTLGFGDVLAIGTQHRPRLFDLTIKKPAPLYTGVFEIDERIAADGTVLRALDPSAARHTLAAARAAGYQSLAICLMNAYCQPVHELRLGELAAELGFDEVSLSHQVSPLVKIVPRGETTVLDAYLNPILRQYVNQLQRALVAGSLRLITSAGSLVPAERFSGKDSILSGPAGGVVGFSRAARAAGFDRALGFDMGGTSTDVSRFDGRFEWEYEAEKAGVRVATPLLAIETVAAGGGSICRFDGVKLVVGPESAGAQPGPACYGRGGPLAVTDLNVYTGRVPVERFPFPLDLAATEQRLDALAVEVAAATGHHYTRRSLCAGFLQVANATMARAIRSVSVARGCDPRDYVLVAFGGAAPQHACAVAHELGITRVLVPIDASLLSAVGAGAAELARHAVTGQYRDYDPAGLAAAAQAHDALARAAQADLLAEGVPTQRIRVARSLDLRYRGQDAALTVDEPPAGSSYAAQFAAEHQRRYGYVDASRPVEIVAARVEVVGQAPPPPPRTPILAHRAVEPTGQVLQYLGQQQVVSGVFWRDELAPGDFLSGPAIVCEPYSTTLVEPGWRARVLAAGELLLERAPPDASPTQWATVTGSLAETATADRAREDAVSATAMPVEALPVDALPNPVELELFNNRFAAVAEQMGLALRNTAISVNVKERLDFSCAVFTAQGDLVVNAPHIPVHLGAMGETVRRVLADNPDLAPGDVFVTNDPYRGGSHLPDVTVVTPVHDAHSGRLLFCTASRAHHAEIGGIRPGSMPPLSRHLAEEGVLLRNVRLVAAGQPRWQALAELLSSGPYPSRNVADNLADLAAQVAANAQGARALGEMIAVHGLPQVSAYMRHIQAAAERKTRAALGRLPQGRRTFVDHLDDGSPLCVAIEVEHGAARIDFTGSAPVLPNNLNANRAIVTAAVMYVMRCLLDEDIPLNQGVLAPLTLLLPEGCLNPPERATPAESAAVVGGNVETSQRVVDVLLGALGLAAASQGTMNNLLFGDATFGYYETICGGAGATPRGPGADAVHTHMTNTRLTDPEILEQRYPVRLHAFRIRRGSGGAGKHRGGDGVVRQIEFLRPLEVSLLTQRRGPYAPYGAAGGAAGACGRNRLDRAAGTSEDLAGVVQFSALAGDVLTIETPGGGGWGPADR